MAVCLPIVNAAMRDIEKGVYPKGFSFDVEVPTSPLANKVCSYLSLLFFFFYFLTPMRIGAECTRAN